MVFLICYRESEDEHNTRVQQIQSKFLIRKNERENYEAKTKKLQWGLFFFQRKIWWRYSGAFTEKKAEITVLIKGTELETEIGDKSTENSC